MMPRTTDTPYMREGLKIGPVDYLRLGRWLTMDAVRRHAPPIAALGMGLMSRVQGLISEASAMKSVMASQRLKPNQRRTEALKAALERTGPGLRRLVEDDIPFQGAAGRSIVLRPPQWTDGHLTPGVLLITFTETLRFFVHHVDMDRLQDYFRIVIEPSWAGYAVPEILSLRDARDPILVETAEATDRTLLTQLDSSLVPVPLGSGEWVDHGVFRPLGLDRTYDAAYVANYAPGKRVPAFLRAVRDIVRAGHPFRAVLVCARWGAGRDTVLRFLDWYGIGEHVDVFESLSQDDLNTVLNTSRCNVLLSLKEGSNRSLFEAMFAGVPGVLLAENVGVNKDHFDGRSGVITREEDLADTLLRVSRDFDSFSPRDWAMANISPEATTAKLDRYLADLFPGDPAASHLHLKVNIPEATYFDTSLRPLHRPMMEKLLPMFLRGGDVIDRDEVLAITRPLTARRS